MRYLRKLTSKQLRGKIVLLRVDFNVENRRDAYRLRASLPTINFILARGAKVVVLSHRGRPKPGIMSQDSFTLRPLTSFLKKNLGQEVAFLDSFDFPKLKKRIDRSSARIFLVENLRFLKGEAENDAKLSKALASLGDLYVNDAFAVSHRKNASVCGITRYLPPYAGLLLEKEINALNKIIGSKRRPLVAILGGAKVRDKLPVISRFLNKATSIILGGGIANTFAKANGLDVDGSLHEPGMVKTAKRLLGRKNIELPFDFVSERGRILDIGPISAARFSKIIKGARIVFWNGPLGFFEDRRFKKGSEAVARALAKSKAYSLVGGGETTQLIRDLRLEKKIDFLSTGGGAMIEYLAGKKLPGIEALQTADNKLQTRN